MASARGTGARQEKKVVATEKRKKKQVLGGGVGGGRGRPAAGAGMGTNGGGGAPIASRGIGAPPGMGSRGGDMGGGGGGGGPGGGGMGGTKRALPFEEQPAGGGSGRSIGGQRHTPAAAWANGGAAPGTLPIRGPAGAPAANGGAPHPGASTAGPAVAPGMMDHLRAQKARADGAAGGAVGGGGCGGGGGMGVPPSGRLKPPPRGIGMGASQFQPRPAGGYPQAGPPPAKHARPTHGLADDEATLARLVGDGAFDDDPCTASS